MSLTRRHFLQTSSLALLPAVSPAAEAQESLIEAIEKVVVKTPALPKGTWFHPRACMIGKRAFMTTQPTSTPTPICQRLVKGAHSQ